MNYFKILRGEKSQTEIAKKYGVSQQSWCKWEKGFSIPRPPLMKKIADDLGKSVDEIFFANNNKIKL